MGTKLLQTWETMHGSVFISNQGDKGGDQTFTDMGILCMALFKFPITEISGDQAFANMGVLCIALFSFPIKETRVGTKLLQTWVSCA